VSDGGDGERRGSDVRRIGFRLLIAVVIAVAAYAGYCLWHDVKRGDLGNDQETIARLTRDLPAGLALGEVQDRLHRLGIQGPDVPDATGVLRFSVKAQMLIRVDAELRFDGSGRLFSASFKSVYTG
jgi:hypothetical protein